MLLLTTTHYQMLTLSLRLTASDGTVLPEGTNAAVTSQFNIVSDSLTDLQDRHARPSDAGQIVIIDPTCSVVCCHLYQGLLKCIAVNTSSSRISSKNSGNTFIDQFNLPIEEVTIKSMVFLHGCQRPTLAVLFQDKKEIRHVKTYEIDLKNSDKAETGWIQSGLSGSNTCIAVPAPIGMADSNYLGTRGLFDSHGSRCYKLFADREFVLLLDSFL